MQISEQNIETLQAKYVKEITELKDLIGNKSSIPKDQVYPRFDALSQIYSQLLEEKNLAILRKELFKVLLEYKDKATSSLPEALIREAKILYVDKANKMKGVEAKIAQNVESQVIEDSNLQILRLMPNNTPDFMHIPLDFLGFCLWTIAEKGGLLMPGKPNLGVFKYKDQYKERYCVFSDERAVDEFLKSPEDYFKKVTQICR